jgi:uncharacterized protein
MPFEYDKDKSRANLNKHGIDFEQAQEIWHDAKATQKKTAFPKEERFIRIGSIRGKLWSAVFTYRGDNIRIISVRRAHADEERQYQSE